MNTQRYQSICVVAWRFLLGLTMAVAAFALAAVGGAQPLTVPQDQRRSGCAGRDRRRNCEPASRRTMRPGTC